MDNSNLLIFRTDHDRNYKTINLTCVQDKRLSWKAKGIHNYLMTRPEDWSVSMEDLKSRSLDGTTSLLTGIEELVRFGYTFKISKRNNKGQFEGNGFFSTEIPKTLKEIRELLEPSGWKICSEDPATENPLADNNPLNNKYSNNIFESKDSKMKIEDDLPASPEKPIDNLPQQKSPSGIKIKRPVLSPEEELLESKNYTERAKRLFQYWNNLAGPIIRHRITNPLSKSCRRALENLDKTINRGYSDEDIKRAMNNYRSLLMLENLRVSSEFCGVNVGLGRFLEQTPFFKERLNKLGVSVDSWFKECLLPWEQLREKYSREKKDTRPEVTEELRRQWRTRTNKKKFTVDEENIFRIVANRVYDYFISLADFKSDTTCNNKNPETCVKFVIKYLESRSHDFNIVPGWIQGQNFLNGSMTAYLTEIGYVQEGWDDSSAKEREERIERSERARKLKEQQDREARESLIGED